MAVRKNPIIISYLLASISNKELDFRDDLNFRQECEFINAIPEQNYWRSILGGIDTFDPLASNISIPLLRVFGSHPILDKALIELLHSDESLTERIIYILGMNKSEIAMPIIVQFLDDENECVRRTARWAMEQYDTPESQAGQQVFPSEDGNYQLKIKDVFWVKHLPNAQKSQIAMVLEFLFPDHDQFLNQRFKRPNDVFVGKADFIRVITDQGSELDTQNINHYTDNYAGSGVSIHISDLDVPRSTQSFSTIELNIPIINVKKNKIFRQIMEKPGPIRVFEFGCIKFQWKGEKDHIWISITSTEDAEKIAENNQSWTGHHILNTTYAKNEMKLSDSSGDDFTQFGCVISGSGYSCTYSKGDFGGTNSKTAIVYPVMIQLEAPQSFVDKTIHFKMNNISLNQ